jgi:hypothetical protein
VSWRRMAKRMWRELKRDRGREEPRVWTLRVPAGLISLRVSHKLRMERVERGQGNHTVLSLVEASRRIMSRREDLDLVTSLLQRHRGIDDESLRSS